MSICIQGRGCIVKYKRPFHLTESRYNALPNCGLGVFCSSALHRRTPSSLPQFQPRPVRWCPPDEKDSTGYGIPSDKTRFTGTRQPGGNAVGYVVRHRDRCDAADYRTADVSGPHHPGPEGSTRDSTSTNGGTQQTAKRRALRTKRGHHNPRCPMRADGYCTVPLVADSQSAKQVADKSKRPSL